MAHHRHRIDEIDDRIAGLRQRQVNAREDYLAEFYGLQIDELLDERFKIQGGAE